MVYGPAPLACTPNHLIDIELGYEKLFVGVALKTKVQFRVQFFFQITNFLKKLPYSKINSRKKHLDILVDTLYYFKRKITNLLKSPFKDIKLLSNT
jgi:hypothetical protein